MRTECRTCLGTGRFIDGLSEGSPCLDCRGITREEISEAMDVAANQWGRLQEKEAKWAVIAEQEARLAPPPKGEASPPPDHPPH